MKTILAAVLLLAMTITADAATAWTPRALVDAEGFGPKIAPHYQLLNKYPVTVIVEYRIEAADGALKYQRGLARITPPADTAILSAPKSSPMIEMRVSSFKAMLELLRNENVVSIRPNDDLSVSLPEVKKIIGWPLLQAAHPAFQGEGATVAVIDTGVMAKGPGCSNPYGPTGSPPAIAGYVSTRVVFGPPVAYGCWTSDDQHGTVVAEIIHAIAPKARIVSLRIGGDTGGITVANMAKAVDWIVANRAAYNIVVANFSVGTHTSYASDCYTSMGNFARTLSEVGVVPVAASGNDGFKTGLAEPACSPFAIAVGAMADAASGAAHDSVLGFSNTGPALDLIAPACTTTTYSSDKKTFGINGTMNCGTSFAAPVVSGAIAAMTVAGAAKMTPTFIRSILINSTTHKALDPLTQKSYPVIDVAKAADALGSLSDPRTGIPPITCAPACIL